MVPLRDVIMAVLVGAEREAWLTAHSYTTPLEGPYQGYTGYRGYQGYRGYHGMAAVWPIPGSKLAQLVEALEEPGAMEYLHRHLQETLTPTISNDLRNMPYPEFLGTRYWWIVKGMLVATRGNHCEGCGSLGILDAHHLTYAHRGSEVFHLDELRLLCRACHDEQHEP